MLLLGQSMKICALAAHISFSHGLYLQILSGVSRGELNALLKDGDLGLQVIYAFREKNVSSHVWYSSASQVWKCIFETQRRLFVCFKSKPYVCFQAEFRKIFEYDFVNTDHT